MGETLEFRSRRSPVYSSRGMVAASQPLAVQAGLSILGQGGNAADAAVAVAAALGVTEAFSTGLGGDCFALFYEARSRCVTALNGSGRAPAALTLERVLQEGFKDGIPGNHAHGITVPGACAGWFDLIERHGALDMAQILAPAIHLADEGFPVAPLTARFWGQAAQGKLDERRGGGQLLINGRAPRPGEMMRMPSLASTMRSIAEAGKRAFYEGPIAERIVAAARAFGGVMTEEDLAEHVSTWEKPISVVCREVRVHECPPNGQGLAALIALNILSRLGLSSLGEALSAPRLHHAVEAMRLAFADARRYVADPAFAEIPLSGLLSPEYAAERAKRIDPRRANPDQPYGIPPRGAGGDTVYFTTADGQGNVCSFVNSLSHPFGTGIAPDGLGFALQNRGQGFSLEPGHPNALEPRKRPYHTIIAGMATRESDGSAYAGFGCMGGFMQPQGHVQLILGLLEDGLDPQAALDRPRFCLAEGEARGDLALEEGIPVSAMAGLAEMGHRVRLVSGLGRRVFGRGQIILRDSSNGVLCGGSDPRADGCVAGI